jgi:hypothetical protein
MSRELVLGGCFLVLTLGAAQAEDVAVEKVAESPAKFKGQKLTFGKMKLAGKMIKHTGLYCLKLTSPEGSEYGAAVSFLPTSLSTFFVQDAIADRLLDEFKEDDEYTVKITCTVYKKKFPAIGAEAWLAEVSEVGLYKDDKIAKVINAKSPRSGKAPSLARVLEAPQKYAGQKLVFDKIKVAGKMIKHTGLYCLKISSEDGTEIGAAVNFAGGLAVFAPERLADKLSRRMKEDDEYTVKITCKVSKKKFPAIGAEGWLAEVSEIGFYEDEKIKDVVK